MTQELEDLITVDFLKEELRAENDPKLQAKLLHELAEREEADGDEPSAARDYLAAYNGDRSSRESLEGLVRLLEERKSHKNLGRLSDALLEIAATDEEKVRALILRATFLAETEEPSGAKSALSDAGTLAPGAAAGAWLRLQFLGAKTGDANAQREALEGRYQSQPDGEWRGLLGREIARLHVTEGDFAAAERWLLAAATPVTATRFAALQDLLELHERPDGDRTKRAQILIRLAELAQSSDARASGVPSWFGAEEGAHALVLAALIDGGGGSAVGGILERALELHKHPLLEWLAFRAAIQRGERARAERLFGALEKVVTDQELMAGWAAALALLSFRQGEALPDEVEARFASPELPAALRIVREEHMHRIQDDAGLARDAEAQASAGEGSARVASWIRAAFYWAVGVRDAAASQEAIAEAVSSGLDEAKAASIARLFARVVGDRKWFGDATLRLVRALPSSEDRIDLWFELIRARVLEKDERGLRAALDLLRQVPSRTRLADALRLSLSHGALELSGEDFSTILETRANDRRATDDERSALRMLAALLGPDAERAQRLLLAWRARADGETRLTSISPTDFLLGLVVAAEEEAQQRRKNASRVLSLLAASTDDPDVAGRLLAKAGLLDWEDKRVEESLIAFENASLLTDEAKPLLAWALRLASRTQPALTPRALGAMAALGDHRGVNAFERYRYELEHGDPSAATKVLEGLLDENDPKMRDWGIAAAFGVIIAEEVTGDQLRKALARLSRVSESSRDFVLGECVRRVSGGSAAQTIGLSSEWFALTHAPEAAFEWLLAAMRAKDEAEEGKAWAAWAEITEGPGKSGVLAQSKKLVSREERGQLEEGASAPETLLALEAVLSDETNDQRMHILARSRALFDEASKIEIDAALAWSLLSKKDDERALKLFERVLASRPNDIPAWEGMRLASRHLDEKEKEARASYELASRIRTEAHAAELFETSGELFRAINEDERAEYAYTEAFRLDPTRREAFEFIFRRTRARKEDLALLDLVGRRIPETDEPEELSRLFWEQARALRARGDLDGAMKSLESVTIFDADHVGALALTGEILLKRGDYANAAESLSRLALLEQAPPKTRLTAGVTAADLYENKLDNYDRAFEVLQTLHTAGLSTLAVRERLARAAARNGHWAEAIAILEVLMEERPEPSARAEAARLAVAIYRDRLGDAAGSGKAVGRLASEFPGDPDVIDMLLSISLPGREAMLEKSKLSLIAQLKTRTDAAVAKRLVRVSQATSDALTECLSLSLVQLVEPTPNVEAALGRARSRIASLPAGRVPDSTLAILAHPGDSGPLSDLFQLLGPTLGAAFGASRSSLGATKKDLVDPRSGLSMAAEALLWRDAFGLPELDVYVAIVEPGAVRVVGDEKPAVVMAADVRSPLNAAQRGAIASQLYGVVRGTLALSGADGFASSLFRAASSIAGVETSVPRNAAMEPLVRALEKAMPRKVKKLLPPICQRVVGSEDEIERWAKHARASQRRAALIASLDFGVALETEGTKPLPNEAARDARMSDLVDFAFSPAFRTLLRAFGSGGNV